MESVRVIKVFLASPMDLAEERAVFRRVLDRISDRFGRRLGARYDVVCWERDVRPDCADDAQDVVNRQVPLDYDVFVALFRQRLGTPTHRAPSGTVEEYERALVYRAARPDISIMCYFLGDEGGEEIGGLKARMAADGVLFHEALTREKFEDAVFGHFTDLLLERVQVGRGPSDLRPDRSDVARSVSVALLDERDRVLILRRPPDAKVAPGLWQLPGGKMDAGEAPVETAVREVGEELGFELSPDDLTFVRIFHSTSIGKGRPRPFDMYLYLYEPRLEAGAVGSCRQLGGGVFHCRTSPPCSRSSTRSSAWEASSSTCFTHDEGIAMVQEKYNIPLILLSLGKTGSRAYTKNCRVEVPAFIQENTIETTGAGDTFGACILHYVLEHGWKEYSEAELTEMLTFANAAASIVTTRKGALRVMPTKEEVQAML